MKNQKGAIATLLTLGLVVIGTAITLGTSLFVNNKNTNLASNSRAAINCGNQGKCQLNSTTCLDVGQSSGALKCCAAHQTPANRSYPSLATSCSTGGSGGGTTSGAGGVGACDYDSMSKAADACNPLGYTKSGCGLRSGKQTYKCAASGAPILNATLTPKPPKGGEGGIAGDDDTANRIQEDPVLKPGQACCFTKNKKVYVYATYQSMVNNQMVDDQGNPDCARQTGVVSSYKADGPPFPCSGDAQNMMSIVDYNNMTADQVAENPEGCMKAPANNSCAGRTAYTKKQVDDESGITWCCMSDSPFIEPTVEPILDIRTGKLGGLCLHGTGPGHANTYYCLDTNNECSPPDATGRCVARQLIQSECTGPLVATCPTSGQTFTYYKNTASACTDPKLRCFGSNSSSCKETNWDTFQKDKCKEAPTVINNPPAVSNCVEHTICPPYKRGKYYSNGTSNNFYTINTSGCSGNPDATNKQDIQRIACTPITVPGGGSSSGTCKTISFKCGEISKNDPNKTVSLSLKISEDCSGAYEKKGGANSVLSADKCWGFNESSCNSSMDSIKASLCVDPVVLPPQSSLIMPSDANVGYSFRTDAATELGSRPMVANSCDSYNTQGVSYQFCQAKGTKEIKCCPLASPKQL